MANVFRNPLATHLMARHEVELVRVPCASDDLVAEIEWRELKNGGELVIKIIRSATPRLRQNHEAR